MPRKAIVIVSALNIRRIAGVLGERLHILPRHAEIEVEDRAVKINNIIWRQLVGERGWIAEIDLTTGERFIELVPPIDPQQWRVTVGRINIRTAPSLTARVIRSASLNEELTIDSSIRTVDDQGWAWRKLITIDVEEWVAEINENSGERLLEKVDQGDIDKRFGITGGTNRVQTRGTTFLLDSRPFRFVGANLREFAYYTRPDLLPAAKPEDQDTQITILRQIGMRIVRLFAPHRLVDATTSIELVRSALDKLHHGNLLAIVVLTDALGDSGHNIPDDHVRFHNQVHGHVNKHTFFHDGGYRQFYLPFVRQIVTALREHPAIFAWELGNEFAIHPQPANSRDSEAFVLFHDEVSRTIRGLDPNHLITTGLVNSGHGVPAFRNAEDFARRLYSLPTLDFATVHFYQKENDPHAAMANEESASLVDLRVVKALGKPIIVEEFGPTINNHNRIGFAGLKMNAWFAAGAAGFMQWGFSATGRDIGVGDHRFGMDNYSAENAPIFGGLVNLYREWAARLANG